MPEGTLTSFSIIQRNFKIVDTNETGVLSRSETRYAGPKYADNDVH